ncbi:MAG: DNA-3-methyladenine glycosylase family protein, partial [Paracoccaceae bacterium]
MTDRIIHTAEDVAEGVAWLAAHDPDMAKVIAVVGEAPLRRRSDGFAALLQAIVGQQVSVAAAAGIWRRVEEAGLITEDAVVAASDDDLRGVGLSRPKVKYARAIAEARLDYAALRVMPVDQAVAEMVAIKGVGQWTAEIYLMFAVGRADVFAPGDLALREAARGMLELEE